MKEITFLRHSKSSWDFDVSDINRPLNEFGIEKIKKIADSSFDILVSSQIIFTSPAIRAHQTSRILCNTLSINFDRIKVCKDLYTFSKDDVFNFIKAIDNDYSKVVLVGHNPAYTEISNYFSENKILNLPTARWFSLRFDTNHWSNIFDLKPLSYINNLKSGT